MKRRSFIGLVGLGSSALASGSILCFSDQAYAVSLLKADGTELHANLVIAGGGVGGCAAALAVLRNGLQVILTEETDWIGGQLTQQGVPPDEHIWIETHGGTKSYRQYRTSVRNYYRNNYPLTDAARSMQYLNPGNAGVSVICHEPGVSLNETHELHAPEKADPDNHQAFTMCFAMDYLPGTNNVGDKPAEYDFWRNLVPQMKPAWPGKLSCSYMLRVVSCVLRVLTGNRHPQLATRNPQLVTGNPQLLTFHLTENLSPIHL